MTHSTLLGKFCAVNKNWEQILSTDPFNLKIKRDGDFVIFNYNQLSSDFSNAIVREARGIIFREGEWEIPVCHGFDKFFNYGEPNAANIDWNSAMVTEKIDGSLIKVWYDKIEEVWHISTNGTIDAFKAETGDYKISNYGELFISALGNHFEDLFRYLIPDNNTYLFELVSPVTRVVIPYEKTALYFLGFRDNCSSYICPFYSVRDFSPLAKIGIKQPKVYDLSSLESCLAASKKLPWDEEGYVVDDGNYNRVKIKSPEYVIAHHVRNNSCINQKALIEIIFNNEIDEFLVYADDYKDAIDEIRHYITDIKNASKIIGKSVMILKDSGVFADKKTYALYIQKCVKESKFYSIFSDYLFKLWENTTLKFDEYTANKWNTERWSRAIDIYREEFNCV